LGRSVAACGGKGPRPMMGRSKRAAWVLAAGIVVAWALGRGAGGPTFVKLPVGGGAAPDWSATDLNGHPAGSEAFRGKIVVLNFWATWCAPCLRELPALAAFHRRHAVDGVIVAGASAGDDDDEALRAFARRIDLPYPVFKAGAAMRQQFGGGGLDPMSPGFPLPSTWIVRRDGTMASHYLGALTGKELERALALAEAPAGH